RIPLVGSQRPIKAERRPVICAPVPETEAFGVCAFFAALLRARVFILATFRRAKLKPLVAPNHFPAFRVCAWALFPRCSLPRPVIPPISGHIVVIPYTLFFCLCR